MIRRCSTGRSGEDRVPRERGDDPYIRDGIYDPNVCSPHAGMIRTRRASLPLGGVFPASAGMIRVSGPSSPPPVFDAIEAIKGCEGPPTDGLVLAIADAVKGHRCLGK